MPKVSKWVLLYELTMQPEEVVIHLQPIIYAFFFTLLMSCQAGSSTSQSRLADQSGEDAQAENTVDVTIFVEADESASIGGTNLTASAQKKPTLFRLLVWTTGQGWVFERHVTNQFYARRGLIYVIEGVGRTSLKLTESSELGASVQFQRDSPHISTLRVDWKSTVKSEVAKRLLAEAGPGVDITERWLADLEARMDKAMDAGEKTVEGIVASVSQSTTNSTAGGNTNQSNDSSQSNNNTNSNDGGSSSSSSSSGSSSNGANAPHPGDMSNQSWDTSR